MPDAANLNGIGIGADEEKPVVPDLQSKFFSSLQSFHIAGLTPGLGIRACENSFASAAGGAHQNRRAMTQSTRMGTAMRHPRRTRMG